MKDRHLELSGKLIEMGRALMAEGHENKDYTISQLGASMITMSGLLMTDDKNMFLFSQMCGLFSTKMIYESANSMNKDKESYEDFIKRINRLRDGESNNPPTE